MAARPVIPQGKDDAGYLCYSTNSYLGRLTASVIEREDLRRGSISRYECSMSDVLKRCALAGEGIAWIPELAVRDELAAGTPGACGRRPTQLVAAHPIYRGPRRGRPGGRAHLGGLRATRRGLTAPAAARRCRDRCLWGYARAASLIRKQHRVDAPVEHNGAAFQPEPKENERIHPYRT